MHTPTQQLWDDFLQDRTPELKRRLVVQYLDLVRYVVSKYNLHQQAKSQGMEFDDIVHFGVLGLLTAVDRFAPAQNVKFETYAVPRIRGAILDEMRKLDWVPRSVRETSRRIGKAAHAVAQENGREPLEEEIASKLELSLEEYHKLIGGNNAVPSRDADYMTESESAEPLDAAPSDSPSPFDRISDQETRAILMESVERLSERDRTVIALYYYEGLKFTEIAKVLSISEGRVSQIHSEVLRNLRNRLVAMEA
jgi:RNA polymerase sigma factor FliA